MSERLEQLKQRIAECISHPPLNGCDTRDLLRDCLKHIEELEKEKSNLIVDLGAEQTRRSSTESRLSEREAALSQLVKAINEAYGECDCGGECDLCQLKQRISKIIP